MMKPVAEKTLQKEVASFFRDLEERSGAFTFTHVPNGGKRDKWEGKSLKKMGVLAGVHDLLFWMPNGLLLMIELKSIGGDLSNAQKRFHAIVSGFGFRSYVTTGYDGNDCICRILDILESHGFVNKWGRPASLAALARMVLDRELGR